MKIGIIGGGAAGLACAWLLNDQHEVMLFEKEDRLGGHAHTVRIEAHGQQINMDAGFQFFSSGSAYTTFNRLLDILNVPRQSYPATLTVYQTAPQRQRPVIMPPFRGCLPIPAGLSLDALGKMIRFRGFLSGAVDFLERHDTSVTIAEYIDRQRLPKAFVDDFLYPLLLSFWCVELDDFKRFAAYNALYYLGANQPGGLSAPQQSEIPGGLRVYIDLLTRTLDRTQIRLRAAIRRVTREGEGYAVEDADGSRHPFDRLILATNAQQALRLLDGLPDLDTVRRELSRFEYFETTIALHGDRRLMPASEAAWSVVNARWDGTHSALSAWNPRRGLPIFKSWVTYEARMPEPLYALAHYQHGKVTVDYFDAQRRLKALNGQHNLWLAGLYMDDADSHESAIRSAVTVAERIAPESARLKQLVG